MESPSSSLFSQIDQLAENSGQTAGDDFVLPASVVSDFEQNGIKSDELSHIIGPKDQIAGLIKLNEPLPPDLVERVARLAYIVSLSEKVFGDRDKAFTWLRLKNASLDDRAPIDLLDKEHSSRVVEDALMRIEYGVYN